MNGITLFILILTIYVILFIIIAPLWAMIDRNLQEAQLLESGREANEALARVEEMMSMTNSFIFYLKADRTIIFPSRFFELTHLRNRPVPMEVIERCMNEEDKKAFCSALCDANTSEKSIRCTFTVPTTGHEHVVKLTINKNLGDEQTTCIGSFMVIDDIKKAERQREEALHMDEEANVKASFLASMGHEIRTPLNAIVGFSQIITSQYEYLSDEDRKGFFDIIKQNNDLLLSLLDSVTTASNDESDSLKVVLTKKKVADLMEEIYLTHTVIVPKRLQFIFNRGNAEDYVMINRNCMLQIMSNLMNNAIKFTMEGSITLGWESDDDHVTFYVQDTGIGIKPENHESIFTRFVTSGHCGAGFGLPLCKRFVTKMNGKIVVHSTVDKGSRFEVIFDKCK